MDICDAAWNELEATSATSYRWRAWLKDTSFLSPYVHPDDQREEYVTSPKNYPWYRYYAEIKKPKAILEIGVRRGYSIISMCLGHKPDHVFLMDNCADGINMQEAIDGVRGLGVGSSFYGGDSQNGSAFGSVNACGRQYDLIHIDGEHTPDALTSDLRYSKFLAPDGWIIVDDVHDMPELMEVCKEFAKNGWDLVEVPTFRGHAVMRRTP